MGYNHIWQIILKVLLCISICILGIFLFSWSKKYFAEGFQGTTTLEPEILGTGVYGGTVSSTYEKGASQTSSASSVPTNVVLINLSGTAGLKYFKFQLPVKILENNTVVGTGKLFAYNKPTNVTIFAESGTPWTVSGTGITWASGSGERPSSTVYKIQAEFCDIEINKADSKCNAPNIGNLLPAETPAEQNIYDNYEMYNIDNPPTPSYTQMQKYDMASELSKFDTGAEIPWDYDNRTFNPSDILWGNIHPNVSQEIFRTAYTRDVLKSINNLEYDESSKKWEYKSLIFERTWRGDDRRFLPGIQTAEFLAETGIAIVVGAAYAKLEDSIMTRTNWGRTQTAMIDADNAGDAMRRQTYFAALNSGLSRADAEDFSRRYGLQHYNEQMAMHDLNSEERAACRAESDRIMGATGTQQRIDNDRNLTRIMEANNAMNAKADEFRNRSLAPTAVADTVANNVEVRRAEVTNAGSARSLSLPERLSRPPEVDSRMRVNRSESRGITSAILRWIGFTGATKLAQLSSGKIALKLARAIGFTLAGEGLLWGAATAICGPSAAVTAGTSCAFLFAAVTAINVFIDFFVIACCSFVPAILATYIPDDAVCPAGYFNIHDAMVKLPGGEAGWQIIGAIPGLGDGLSAFGPYLCSKVEGSPAVLTDVVLKKERLTPGYFYDSTLSIFCDIDKAPMPPPGTPGYNDLQFNDSRRYTENASTPPAWSDSGIPPIWVDFADTTMLNKMAQFYYTYSRRLATNNYDGTYTFEYISKFYGIIASSLYSCDVQCEITSVTYYQNTGVEQTKYIVPVDPANETTYHDRRFYFYPIQVENTTKPETDPERISAKNIEDMYKRKGYSFKTWEERKNLVKGSDNNLNDLMTDNQKRYIVTACTNSDGTAPNAAEVDSEGAYVGDALISLGDYSPTPNYYPPVVSINSSMLISLTSAYTIVPIDLEGQTSSKLFTYNNPLISFIETYKDTNGTEYNADTVTGVEIDSSNNIQNPGNTFTGTVTAYTNSTPQKLTIQITRNTIASGSKNYRITVATRSSGARLPMNDNGCSAIRNRAFRSGQRVSIPPTDHDAPQSPSFTITTPSTTPVTWNSFNYENTKNNPSYRTGFNTAKIWEENYIGQIMSDSVRDRTILQGTAMGYVGFRFNWGMIPVGALFTQGVLSTNFDPDWSIASLWSCSYQDMIQSFGTYTSNGEIITIQTGTNNRYLFIKRGPLIKFAPGYTPTIDKMIINLTQTDCINRNAIRSAIKTYNTQNVTEQVTKVLKIETDSKNKQCLYLFQTVPYDATTNVRTLNRPTNKAVVVRYNYSDSQYSLIQGTNLINTILNSDGTYSPSPPNFTLSIAATAFPTSGNVWDAIIKPANTIQVRESDIEFTPITNLTRDGSSDTTHSYNCDSPAIKNRLIVQFNAKNKLNPRITTINNSYVPSTGVKNGDGTFTCIYDANVTTINDNRGTSRTDPACITMTLIPANDSQRALYDLLEDNYPSAYVYQAVPKPNQWIDIPLPLVAEKNISRGTNCESMSTCQHPDIISNLVNQFNRQMVDGKIMKVRKAYTPSVGSNVCDFEVEMLRIIPGRNTSIIQKESIRMPLIATPGDDCKWDLNMTGSNIPIPDTGLSLTNSASVALLDNPYIWSPSYLTSIRQSINGALLNYLNIDVNNILSNATVAVNRQVINVYNTVMTAQYLTHPDPTCKLKCSDSNVVQAIIDRYYADNYPVSQYGVQRAQMMEIRRVGTYTSTQCQIEFIERIDNYKNFISSVIFSSDASNPDAKYNTKYYLRQYQFDMVPEQGECAHNMVPITNLVGSNALYRLDISGNGLAIMSDSSVVSKSQSDLYSYTGKDIDCANTNVLNAVVNKYNAVPAFYNTNKFNTIKNISTVFNRRTNICEYNATATKWFKSRINNSYYELPNQKITLEAQWGSYNPRKALIYSDLVAVQPEVLAEYDPAQITVRLDANGVYQAYNSIGNTITLPYTYNLPVAYDRSRVSTIRFNCTNGMCSFS